MEVGPYRLQDKDTLVPNNGSWHEFANLLFVDNPVGTGFSYVDTDSFIHELDTMADHFVKFLDKWFALFPEYEDDDVRLVPCSISKTYAPANNTADLHRRRVLRRSTYPLHCRCHTQA